MDFDGNLLKFNNISALPEFQALETAFANYGFFDDPMLGGLTPQYRSGAFNDSFVIQIIRTDLAKTYADSYFKQAITYTSETEHIIDLGVALMEKLQHLYPGHFWLKGHFVCLLPGGEQALHVDRPFWQQHAHRLVVPIVTNSRATTQVGDDIVHMETGQLYEMNNLRMHGSKNLGSAIRVHLFLDFIPPDRLATVEEYYSVKPEPMLG